MKFLWAKNSQKEFNDLVFTLNIQKECDTLYICAVDEYRVFLDGKFICYGPSRTAAGYSHPKKINLNNNKLLEIKVISYNISCLNFDLQKPFFGAEIKNGDKAVYNSDDFICYKENARNHNVTRYSRQRTFVEIYDLRNQERIIQETMKVDSPIILDVLPDYSNYNEKNFQKLKDGIFTGFDEYDHRPWWYAIKELKEKPTDFIAEKDFFEYAQGFNYIDFVLDRESTGFIKLNIKAEQDTEIFVAFEEIMINGKWKFYRSAGNEYFKITVKKGETEFITSEPYVMKYLKVIYNNSNTTIIPQLITLENNSEICVNITGNEKLEKIFNAAINTFRQNALDIFMDCPGRERAGYLCDSYFTAKAERFLFNRNDIEKAFLTNYIISTTNELPKGMLPMCYPAQVDENFYIPNWAMWFNIEICDYYKRTKDIDLIYKAKDKVYGVINSFNKYFNEYELLEDLESWVFVEWSICNNSEYTKGVNFPSNMLYAHMISEVGSLYNDEELIEKSRRMKESILKISYNGELFIENAIRENGKLMPCKDHLSETCQYYALFASLCPDKEFYNRMLNDFGPLSPNTFNEIGKSNMFIGHYLRFLWLNKIEEKDRLLQESIPCFESMVEKTNTLWEKDDPSASCCHGFASVIAMLITSALVDYDEYTDIKQYNGIKRNEKYGVSVTFNY